MADKTEPLLNLDTLVEHRTVRIDRVEYDLLNPEEVSLLDYHRIQKQSNRVAAMMEAAEMTDEQAEDLSRLLDSLCKFVLRAPEEVHAKLIDTNKLRVIEVFTNLQRGTATAATPPEAPANQ